MNCGGTYTTKCYNQLGGSYIMEAQVTQVENVSCHTSISNFRLSST